MRADKGAKFPRTMRRDLMDIELDERRLPVTNIRLFDRRPLEALVETVPSHYGVQYQGDTPQNRPPVEVGYTYLGQFVDHDIAFSPRVIDPGTRWFGRRSLELQVHHVEELDIDSRWREIKYQ